jgi:hypothetical protein
MPGIRIALQQIRGRPNVADFGSNEKLLASDRGHRDLTAEDYTFCRE